VRLRVVLVVLALSVAALAFGVGAAVLWPSVGAPLRAVGYSFLLNDVTALAEAESAVTFALIADVHLRETPRSEIPSRHETERILQRFLASMHEEVRPDFIVQLGDVVDGWTDTCQPLRYDHGCMVASNDVILPRLELLQRITKDRTSIPWFDVIGNHEYIGALSEEIPERLRAIREEWTEIEDTWYYRDVKGLRLIFLNTAYPGQSRTFSEVAHI
jgi:3',5'-cyclic AMP phosphodiesterase CpdA